MLGCSHLTVAVDHKPLLKIFADRSLDIPNTRLRNLKEKTLRYKFSIVHIPGFKHKATDALSRCPVGQAPLEPPTLQDDKVDALSEQQPLSSSLLSMQDSLMSLRYKPPRQADTDANLEPTIAAIVNSLSSVTLGRIQEATNSDPFMQMLSSLIEHGMTHVTKSKMPTELQEYHQYRKELWLYDGIIMYRERVVVPYKLRALILDTLHSAHQGVTSMISRAESTVFWPGITAAIANKCTIPAKRPVIPPYRP